MDDKSVYIGDGVYAQFDGYGVWLMANDPVYPSGKVYLEPSVLKSLNLMMERWMKLEDKKKNE